MDKRDEKELTYFLGENPRFFIEKEIPELPKMMQKAGERGGTKNPYGIPLIGLEGISNPASVIDYLSGVYLSSRGRKATDFLRGWVQTGIDQTLQRVLRGSGHALEWYILEMLIHTKGEEGGTIFTRPPAELDMKLATDLLYINFNGIKSGGKTLGIQITAHDVHSTGFKNKRDQIINISRTGLRDGDLKKFGDKKPDAMGIIGIYGRIGRTVLLAGSSAFCKDLGLPISITPEPFKESIKNETKDIADFIRMSIKIWNNFYRVRKRYEKLQKIQLPGRDGEYSLEWKYRTTHNDTLFTLKKNGNVISHFEILDAA